MKNINRQDKNSDKKWDKLNQKIKTSHMFITALAIVSIIGFIGIISRTLFEFDLTFYSEALLMIVIGCALMIEGQIWSLLKIKRAGLSPKNFTRIITVVVGVIALMSGIFSFSFMRIETQGFNAVKGILSVIAIVMIIIQTWIVE